MSEVRLSVSALANNMRVLQHHAGSARLWPAVKANAYGHGRALISGELARQGHLMQCVAFTEEATQLLSAGSPCSFLVMAGPGGRRDAAVFAKHARRLTPAISCLSVAKEFNDAMMQRNSQQQQQQQQQQQLGVHVMVDTGMSRQGVHWENAQQLIDEISSPSMPYLRLAGVMSHFACADEGDLHSAKQQLERFRRVTANCRPDVLKHICNSAGILQLASTSAEEEKQQAAFDVCRPGISVYGLQPGPETRNTKQLQPVLSWYARVTLVKSIRKGQGVSYGHAYVAPEDMRIAVISAGYGDGLPRGNSGRMHVVAIDAQNGGQPHVCQQVGRITMDQIVVRLGASVHNVREGDQVQLIGDHVTADQIALEEDTINYEVTTRISARPRRILVD